MSLMKSLQFKVISKFLLCITERKAARMFLCVYLSVLAKFPMGYWLDFNKTFRKLSLDVQQLILFEVNPFPDVCHSKKKRKMVIKVANFINVVLKFKGVVDESYH